MKQVQYIDLGECQIGGRAVVKTLDHPNRRANREWCLTSRVVEIAPGPNGPTFKTAGGTEYRPADDFDGSTLGCFDFDIRAHMASVHGVQD